MDLYQNIHTGEVSSIIRVETIKIKEGWINIYVLNNGSRVNEFYFRKHWKLMGENVNKENNPVKQIFKPEINEQNK